MTPDQIDTAIAEFIGWSEIHHVEESRRLYGLRPKSEDWKYRLEAVPQFHRCLNAMREAEESLTRAERAAYAEQLTFAIRDQEEVGFYHERFVCIHIKASQRSEALLRTIGKWKEAE